jgi:tRNA (guanine37-N1)-methyltransferase
VIEYSVMQIDVLTLFPEMFTSPFGSGIVKRAVESNLVKIDVYNIRDWTHDKHHTVDDNPYGGGAGMVLKPQPIFEAVEAVTGNDENIPCAQLPVILLSPQGRLFSHSIATDLARYNRMILICGHYEGVDERVTSHLVTDEISIGDYVLTGGELPAMVVVDAVVRLIPGVLGSEESKIEESHAAGLLEYPQYTRPPEYRGYTVPEILLSGDHGAVARWRREQSVLRTLQRRPELLDKACLTSEEKRIIDKSKTFAQK